MEREPMEHLKNMSDHDLLVRLCARFEAFEKMFDTHLSTDTKMHEAMEKRIEKLEKKTDHHGNLIYIGLGGLFVLEIALRFWQ